MSLYQLNRIMYLLELDAPFLAGMKSNPAAAVKDMDLTEEERAALLSGDIGRLYLMGVNMFILDSIARHELFGITRDSYLQQIRAAAERQRQDKDPSAGGSTGLRP